MQCIGTIILARPAELVWCETDAYTNSLDGFFEIYFAFLLTIFDELFLKKALIVLSEYILWIYNIV